MVCKATLERTLPPDVQEDAVHNKARTVCPVCYCPVYTCEFEKQEGIEREKHGEMKGNTERDGERRRGNESVNCNKKGRVVLTGCRAEAGQRRRRGERKGDTADSGGGSISGWWLISGLWHCHLIQPASRLQQHWTRWTRWAKMAATLHCTQWTPQHSGVYSIARTVGEMEGPGREGERGQGCCFTSHLDVHQTIMPRCITGQVGTHGHWVSNGLASYGSPLWKSPRCGWWMWFANKQCAAIREYRSDLRTQSQSNTCSTCQRVGCSVVI